MHLGSLGGLTSGLLNTGLGSFGGLLGGGGGNSGGLFGTQQGTIGTQSSNSPWAPIQPYLTFGFGQAQNLYNQGASPYLNQAADLQARTALSPNLTTQAQGQLGKTIAGDYLNPETNPAFKESVSNALGLAGSTFAGQYGGPAGQNLGNSGYQESLARGLGQAATQAYSNAYQQERQNQLNALSQAPGLDYANSGALFNAGQMAQQARWSPLQMYQSSLFGGMPQFGQGTNQTPYFNNNTATTLGALTGGLGMFKMLGGAGSLFGGGAAGAAGAGGLAGAADALPFMAAFA